MDKDKIKTLTTTSLNLLQASRMQQMTIETARKFLDEPFAYIVERDGKRFKVPMIEREWIDADGNKRFALVAAPSEKLSQKEKQRQRKAHAQHCIELHDTIIDCEKQLVKQTEVLYDVIRALHAHIFGEELPPLVNGDDAALLEHKPDTPA